MQLAGWVVLCGLVSYALRRRPLLCVVGILGLWVLLPAIAGGLLTGRDQGSLSLHPATWLILTTLAAQLLHNHRSLLRIVARHIYLSIALALVIAVAILTTKYGLTGSGSAVVLDQLVGPVCLFVLVMVAIATAPRALDVLRNTLVCLATATSLIAIAQWLTGQAIVYESSYSTLRWFAATAVVHGRWMGTLDHPLTLSFLICLAVPLVVGISRRWLQFTLLAILGTGLIITQSRIGLAAMAVGVAYVVFRTRTTAGVKVVLGALVAGAVYVASATAATAGISQRLVDDTGSAAARGAAFTFVVHHWPDFLVAGDGVTSNYQVARAAGLTTSLESSILMYAVDIGVVFTVLYFGAQLVIVLRAVGRPTYPGLLLTAVIALVIPQTYSALGAGSAAGALLWTVLAMVVASTDSAEPTIAENSQVTSTAAG